MIKALANKLLDSIKEDFGVPVALKAAIAAQPEIRARLTEYPQAIAATSITQWHDWGVGASGWPPATNAVLRGWQMCAGQYSSDMREVPALKNICIERNHDHFACDIRQITGLAASKSELYDYPSLSEMAVSRCMGLMDDFSRAGMQKNLEWPEIRIEKPHSSDHFQKYSWDDGLYLINSGGSHHFAAAHHIATSLNDERVVRARLKSMTLNAEAVSALTDEYEIFVIDDKADFPGPKIDFTGVMRACKAPFYWKNLPAPDRDKMAVFLPRNELRSMNVAEVFRENDFIDLGKALTELASPNAASILRARRDEALARIVALPGLEHSAGPAYVFGQHAKAAMGSGPAALINWQMVELSVIRECISEHQQEPEAIIAALQRVSPGSVSEQSAASMRADVRAIQTLIEHSHDQHLRNDDPAPT